MILLPSVRCKDNVNRISFQSFRENRDKLVLVLVLEVDVFVQPSVRNRAYRWYSISYAGCRRRRLEQV